MDARRTILIAVRDAVIVVVGCAALALGVNAARARPLPLVAKEPYRILVPCPVISGHADELPPTDPAVHAAATLLVDARPAADFAAWHADKAINIPYDFLESVPAAAVRRVLESSAARVVVYGDGGDPDSGRELAKELSAKGIRNVGFVKGGAPALREGPP